MLVPKHIQDMVAAALERDRKSGNDFWTTPMTKEKLAPITPSEWKAVWKTALERSKDKTK